MNSFKPLATFQFQHFYGISSSELFDIQPCFSTEQVLKNYSILMRQEKDSLFLLYKTDASNTEPLKPFPPFSSSTNNDSKSNTLRFYLYAKNPYLENITEIQHHSLGKTFFLTTKNKSIINNTPGLYFLHTNAPSSEYISTNDFFDFQNTYLNLWEMSNTPILYQLYNKKNLLIFQKEVFPEDNIIQLQHNFDSQGSGLYTLKKTQGGQETHEVFYAANTQEQPSSKQSTQKPFGILEILLSDLVNAQGQPQGYKFTLPFKNRSTFWRYYIIPKYTSIPNSNTLAISGGNDLSFTSIGTQSMGDGSSAYIFQSEEELPLKREAIKNIALTNNTGIEKTLIQNLPNPTIQKVVLDQNDLSKVYSDVYLYV